MHGSLATTIAVATLAIPVTLVITAAPRPPAKAAAT